MLCVIYFSPSPANLSIFSPAGGKMRTPMIVVCATQKYYMLLFIIIMGILIPCSFGHVRNFVRTQKKWIASDRSVVVVGWNVIVIDVGRSGRCSISQHGVRTNICFGMHCTSTRVACIKYMYGEDWRAQNSGRETSVSGGGGEYFIKQKQNNWHFK